MRAQTFLKEAPMTKSREKSRLLDGLQGVSALIGITLGVIPLISWALGGSSGGLLQLILGPLSGAMAYVVPLVVVVLAIGLIAILEAMKRV
jgi:hypothetical protein